MGTEGQVHRETVLRHYFGIVIKVICVKTDWPSGEEVDRLRGRGRLWAREKMSQNQHGQRPPEKHRSAVMPLSSPLLSF